MRRGIEPLYVGEQGSVSPRDVFLELCPRPSSLLSFVALREHARRPTLLLVPSLESLGTEVALGHAAGAKVEIDALGDALALRGGRIRAAPRLRSAHASPPRVAGAAEREPAATLVPRARRWADLLILCIDKHTILVKVGWRRQRLTYVDLGLAGKKSREPTKVWVMLLAICAGRGELRWSDFGSFDNAKGFVKLLRKALRAAFGVEEDPYHRLSYPQGWRARFQAGMWTEEEEKDDDDAPARRAWGERAEGDEGREALDGRAESAWAVAFEDWEGKAMPARATRAPREE
jgi:hypothetical protein